MKKETLENTCIKVLSTEHGAKVIEYYKSLGVDVADHLEGSCVGRYYGLFDGTFDHYSTPKNSKVIELPEDVIDTKPKTLEYPRVMLVSVDNADWQKRVVFMEKCGRFLAWCNVETLEGAENMYMTTDWKYAKEIEEVELEITKEDLLLKVKELEDQIKKMKVV